jgi:hypothetical protein
MEILGQAPQITPPPETPFWQRGVAALGDALSAYGAGISRNPSLRTDHLGALSDLRARREAIQARNQAAQGEAQRSAAERRLSEMDRADAMKAAKEQSDAARWDAKEERFMEGAARSAERAEDRKYREAEREDEQAFRQQMATSERDLRIELQQMENRLRSTPKDEKPDRRDLQELAGMKQRLAVLLRGGANEDGTTRPALLDQLRSGAITPESLRQLMLDNIEVNSGVLPDAMLAEYVNYYQRAVEPIVQQYEKEAAKATEEAEIAAGTRIPRKTKRQPESDVRLGRKGVGETRGFYRR